jgi:hypothetical protein
MGESTCQQENVQSCTTFRDDDNNLTSVVTADYLECGSSRVENEHNDNEVEESNNGLNSNRLLEDINTVQSITSLQSIIAADIVQNDGTGNVVTMFTSPFEDFTRRSSSSQNNNNNNRFYQLPLIYCDQTASNRALVSIERYISNVCLPLYGNTHTNTSITGSQSTAFVAEARQIVAEETNAKITGKASLDIVLFA